MNVLKRQRKQSLFMFIKEYVCSKKIGYDLLLAFVVGNLAKFCLHLFMNYESEAFTVSILAACFSICILARSKVATTVFCAFTFASHELWFDQLGGMMNVVYIQYDAVSFISSLVVFLLFQTAGLILWILGGYMYKRFYLNLRES